jgi:hypothetical protein
MPPPSGVLRKVAIFGMAASAHELVLSCKRYFLLHPLDAASDPDPTEIPIRGVWERP